MPIDINLLRADKGGDPDYWREVMRKRFKPVELVDRVIDLDSKWRKAQFDLEQARKEIGVLQKKVTEAKKAGDNATADEVIATMAELKAAIPAREAGVDEIKKSLDRELNKVPNDVDPGVPLGNDEAKHNTIYREWGECTTREGLLHHHELLWMIDGYEPERGVGVAGHRAYFLKGVGLLLNQALISYGLSFLAAREYTPLMPPFFMNRDVMAGVAQLEDFDEQLYKVTGEGSDDTKYLIATSEQPICAFHRGEWMAEKDLPKRYAGYSACFRKEAGSHGRDTWGIFRVHQFDKVEQFMVCEPEHSAELHRGMIATAEAFYQSLGIPYRVVNICAGELNNAAAIKYDLEGWFPTLATHRELVSASNCTDYQSRAMEVRCGLNKKAGPAGEPSKKYVHFLNGTLCATTRTICAILENYQTAEGVKVPDVLVPFLGGMTFFPFKREKPVQKAEVKEVAGATAVTATTAPPHVKQRAAAPPATTSLAERPAQLPQPGAAPAPAAPAPSLLTRLAELNTRLSTASYIGSNKFAPSKADAEQVDAFEGLEAAALDVSIAGLPHVKRWLAHVRSFTRTERERWT